MTFLAARPRKSLRPMINASPLVIREETRADVCAREALLDAAMGAVRFEKTSERLREGRKPARGLALIAVRSLAYRGGRTLLTLVGIGLGVALLFASVATGAAIDRSVETTVGATLGRADLRMVPQIGRAHV